MSGETILQARNLCKRFGGLAAVDDVSLEVQTGALHAIIGPNGAGKTTLLNLLSGDLPASSGEISCAGHDVTSWAPEKRSRLGIGRTYQKTNIFFEFTTLENCRLAAQSRFPRPFQWWQNAASNATDSSKARCALDTVGLALRAADLARTLSHGEQRQLEIAMCLATEPQLLLFDEPLAGIGAEESKVMIELIARLAENHAVLLIEHDMDAVFQLAKILTVMANGKVLAAGTPEAIRANRKVQHAYLGALEVTL